MTNFARLLGLEDLSVAPQTDDVPKHLSGFDFAAKTKAGWTKLGTMVSYTKSMNADDRQLRLASGGIVGLPGPTQITLDLSIGDPAYREITNIYHDRKQTDFAFFYHGKPFKAKGMIREVGDVQIRDDTMAPIDIEIILIGDVAVGKSLEQRALDFATAMHSGQVRKYSGRPYIYHPIAVAEVVRGFPHTEVMIAAALVHDTVEDTTATIEQVELELGPEVAELVGWLTDVSRPEDGNRAMRKQLDLEHLAKAPAEAQTIKLADLVDNSSDIAKNDPNFWKVYRIEKLALLGVLTKGNAILRQIARNQIVENDGF